MSEIRIFDVETGANRYVAAEAGDVIPLKRSERVIYPAQGMSTRDEFAAAAMQGILAGVGADVDTNKFEDVARIAYDMADAMMEQRNKRP